MSLATYPRPDFERTQLRWQSLNGPWDFLFDDDDVGRAQAWHRQPLPAQVTVAGERSNAPARGSDGDTITQRIAAGTQDLIQNNVFTTSSSTTHNKRHIQVPYVFQSPASGINERSVHEVLWYERQFPDIRSDVDKQRGDRLILRFGAVDYEAQVWVNGSLVGGHRGGHVPFELDISDAVDAAAAASNRLTLRVFDSAYDLTQPRGKQYWGAKPESIFYTPSGGIWQSVWLETVPAARIADSSHGTLLRSNDIASGALHTVIAVEGRKAGQVCSVELSASFAGFPVRTSARKELSKESNHVAIDLDLHLPEDIQAKIPVAATVGTPLNDGQRWRNGVALWSPEHPQLYDLSIKLLDGEANQMDEVKTTVGMRSLDWTRGDGLFRLNDRPYFQALCLDQGYWPDTFMTAPSPDSLKDDIVLAKKMGLNGCRKHQKVEDPIFYYWADKLGYLVWGEMASAYQFSDEYVDRFNQEWTEAVKLTVNHPSVVTWTTVNESWGYTSLKDNVQQRNHIRNLYYLTKSLDPTRPINDNCGWEHVCTDLTTFHDYADGPQLEKTCADLAAICAPKAGRDMFVGPVDKVDSGTSHLPGTPVMCTEFGGVNIAKPGLGLGDRDWGYTTAKDPEDLLKRLERLVNGVTAGGHCCAFVYTQLADIEQEVNGLYSFDRKEKLDSTRMKAIIDNAIAGFYKRVL